MVRALSFSFLYLTLYSLSQGTLIVSIFSLSTSILIFFSLLPILSFLFLNLRHYLLLPILFLSSATSIITFFSLLPVLVFPFLNLHHHLLVFISPSSHSPLAFLFLILLPLHPFTHYRCSSSIQRPSSHSPGAPPSFIPHSISLHGEISTP